MSGRLTVSGGGVACAAAAALLARGGHRLHVAPDTRPRPPVVLGEPTVRLLLDLFGGDPGLFVGAHQLRRRWVSWGSAPVCREEPALILDGATLTARLWERLPAVEPLEEAPAGVSYVGSTPPPAARERLVAGRRRAIVLEAELAEEVDEAACLVEATPEGWLFLAPRGGGRASLQVVVPDGPSDIEEAVLRVLAVAHLVPPRVTSAEADPATALYSATPELALPLCGPGWVALGASAIRFDPLCGDGTGQAVRGALLAAAALDAEARGEPAEALHRHVEARLVQTFTAHLDACDALYGEAGITWRADRQAARAARARLPAPDPAGLRYRVEGFALVARQTPPAP